MASIERYLAPTNLRDALAALADGQATVLAGGTDLMPRANAGRANFRPALMNIRRVPELKCVDLRNGWVRLGALTTIAQLRETPELVQTLPLLAESADHFASDQIRNMGTIGGNVANASPAGDTLIPLIALDAEIELASANGCRRVPAADFFTGPGRTVMQPNELIVAVMVPVPRPGTVSRFVKFGTRPALDISAISLAFSACKEGQRLASVRVAFGAVAPTPLRGRATEAALEGRALDDIVIRAALQAAVGEIKPIDDVRGSAWYRRELVHNILAKVLRDVANG
jgi:xanthine dehydrogenase FAD-binding subunit